MQALQASIDTAKGRRPGNRKQSGDGLRTRRRDAERERDRKRSGKAG